MVDTLLILDSSKANQPAHRFEIQLKEPLIFPMNQPHSIGLIQGSWWFSWKNIHGSLYNNNELKYSTDSGSSWKIMDIEDGNYNLEQLNDYIAQYLSTEEADDPENASIQIIPNYSTQHILVNLSNGYQVDFNHGNIHHILGFDKKIVTATEYGGKPGNITNDVNMILVHLSCVSSAIWNDYGSDIIFGFTPNVPVSSNMQLSWPNKPVYVALNNVHSLSNIIVRITDQLNRPIITENDPVTLIFHIKPMKQISYYK